MRDRIEGDFLSTQDQVRSGRYNLVHSDTVPGKGSHAQLFIVPQLSCKWSAPDVLVLVAARLPRHGRPGFVAE
jgi:hypothetical protein